MQFQSSPDPKVGCYQRRDAVQCRYDRCFNPHPTRRSGATHVTSGCRDIAALFQSSPDPKVGCYAGRHSSVMRTARCFNPHPTRRSGATAHRRRFSRDLDVFQSSPDPKVGCYSADAAIGSSCDTSFNPHPTRRSGATRHLTDDCVACSTGFNPHPTRRSGATVFASPHRFAARTVSILTRPEGRVLGDVHARSVGATTRGALTRAALGSRHPASLCHLHSRRIAQTSARPPPHLCVSHGCAQTEPARERFLPRFRD